MWIKNAPLPRKLAYTIQNYAPNYDHYPTYLSKDSGEPIYYRFPTHSTNYDVQSRTNTKEQQQYYILFIIIFALEKATTTSKL